MPEIIIKEVFSSVESAIEKIKSNHKGLNYETPWWGDKETDSGLLSNRGYVIGFCDKNNNTQWRLDYDESKKLHINWTQKLPGTTNKECYQIRSIRPQDTLWDYYVSWTSPRIDEIPKDIKERLDKIGGIKKWNGRSWVTE
jgi:hypothetical protein